MLVPRIILRTTDHSALDLLVDNRSNGPLGVFLQVSELNRTEALSIAQEAKRLCLHAEITLLLDDLEVAALVNADGVCCAIDDDMHGRAKDVLGEEKLVGAAAHTIQDVANLYEEGMVDFVILQSYAAVLSSENILGKQKAQSILDDARIMGYDIPIIISGGIHVSNVQDVLDMRCYGLQLDSLDDLPTVFQYINARPLH